MVDAAALLRDAAAQPGKPRVVFIEGPGGEGKSTILYQTVAQLVEDDPRWRVLWRGNDIKPLPAEAVGTLQELGAPVLVATDEADNVADSLLGFVAAAREEDLDSLHFLIAARDTDWRAARTNQARWGELTDFRRLSVRGIDEADAGRIYDAWMNAGDRRA